MFVLFLVSGVQRDHLKFTFEASDLDYFSAVRLPESSKKVLYTDREDGHCLSLGRGLLHYMPKVLNHHAAEEIYITNQ